MLDLKYIRENPEKVKEGCKAKQIDCDIDNILKLDEERRTFLQEVEGLKAQQNKLGKDEIEKGKKLKEQIKEREPQLKEIEEKLEILLLEVPNIPLDDVPIGKD